jgi:hemolysin III
MNISLAPDVSPQAVAAPAKPLLRGWMHLLWFEASLVAGTIVLLRVTPEYRAVTAIYLATVSGLFGTSALYHRGNWSPRVQGLFARLDHAMIFVFIVGSATPLFIIAVPGWTGRALLGILLALAATLLVTHLAWMHAPEALVGAAYVGLGCLGAAALPGVWSHAGICPFVLILSGGVLYIAGTVLYLRRHPDPRPTVFGFHEVFHTFVCAGATLQFIAIAIFIL